MPFVRHVAEKAVDHPPRGGIGPGKRHPQVEEVTPLFPLVQRPKLGSQQFVDPIRQDGRDSGEPPGTHLERAFLEPEYREVLPGVDLDLQLQRQAVFRHHPVCQRHTSPGLFSARLTEPWVENRFQCIQRCPDRAGMNLYQVDVLGITSRRNMKPEKRGATPKRQCSREIRMAEDLYQRPTDDQILLHLGAPGPWSMLSPFGDICARNHRSGSTFAFTRILQRLSSLAPFSSREGTKGTGTGEVSLMKSKSPRPSLPRRPHRAGSQGAGPRQRERTPPPREGAPTRSFPRVPKSRWRRCPNRHSVADSRQGRTRWLPETTRSECRQACFATGPVCEPRSSGTRIRHGPCRTEEDGVAWPQPPGTPGDAGARRRDTRRRSEDPRNNPHPPRSSVPE